MFLVGLVRCSVVVGLVSCYILWLCLVWSVLVVVVVVVVVGVFVVAVVDFFLRGRLSPRSVFACLFCLCLFGWFWSLLGFF